MPSDAQAEDQLILVDLLDRQIGVAPKLEAHQKALLHRAFSVFLWRVPDASESGAAVPQILLQQRAHGKYHSGGLWANSCCSHPRAGESLADAVPRRLAQELGIRADQAGCGLGLLAECGSFVYRAPFANGLTEFEFDHVFAARWTGAPGAFAPDPTEVAALRWIDADKLDCDLRQSPQDYSVWLVGALPFALASITSASGAASHTVHGPEGDIIGSALTR